MKIESLTIRNFKRFENLTIEFKNKATGEIANQFLILGDNGTGKTTILQAIALCLSRAFNRIDNIAKFDWIGWLPGRYWRWGTPEIEMVVHFTDDEIEATLEAWRRWQQTTSRTDDAKVLEMVEEARENIVRIGLEGNVIGGRGQTDYQLVQHFLFWGRHHAAQLFQQDPTTARALFERLPDVFWFDQLRNPATAPGSREIEFNGAIKEEPAEQISYAVGISRLRQSLNRWKLQRLRKGPPSEPVDYLLELENHYNRIFPGRSFSDPEPMYRGGVPSPSDYYFMLSDGNRTYDIEEMSAGEQAVFPMLYEFVRQRIRNSIVLIDEIDLNLHPPLAQALLANLPHLGAGCQFIFTTHSPVISEVVSPHEVFRLEGGRPCL